VLAEHAASDAVLENVLLDLIRGSRPRST